MLIEPIVFETWKPIDFLDIVPGLYLISNFGRIYSNSKQGYLSLALSNGYHTAQLNTIDGKRKTFYVHRLVAYAFIPNYNPDENTDVNHKNLYRDDNFSENLEWVTKQENNYHESVNRGHGIEIKKASGKWGDGSSTYGENNGMAKLKESEVRAMLLAIERGASYSEAIISAGLEPTENMRYNLSHIVRGHRWKKISKDYNIPDHIPQSN